MAVKKGDTVKVHYVGRKQSGEIFDSSAGREPLEFKVGAKQVIEDFDNSVLGLEVGDKKSFTTPAAKAYGEYDPNKIINLPVGAKVFIMTPSGYPMPVVIKEIADGVIKADANHPLAGEDLTFDVELVEVK
jgi:peptidylprolyl isomerase